MRSESPGATATSPDAGLVARARSGDAAAFRALVERHQDRAFALAWRLTGTRDDAEEVAQDAFLRAWRALPGFRGDAAFGTWLHRIVTHVALDRRARMARQGRREVGLDEASLGAAAAADFAGPGGDGGEDRMTARALLVLLAGLSEAQRTAVTLHYLEDRPVLDVARAMDVPENTVKTHLARARAALREAIRKGERRSEGVAGA